MDRLSGTHFCSQFYRRLILLRGWGATGGYARACGTGVIGEFEEKGLIITNGLSKKKRLQELRDSLNIGHIGAKSGFNNRFIQ